MNLRPKASIKVLHITPHLGGGVGTVLLNWLKHDAKHKHTIATLDYANKKAQQICTQEHIPLFSQISTQEILIHIATHDIVLIHFWNHPLLYDFLVRTPLPACRMVLWSHISGLHPPNVITPKILAYADTVVYTTKISQSLAPNKTILSTGGIESYLKLPLISRKTCTVGYIGTVDYVKMHPHYIETLAQSCADTVLIVGGDKEKEISASCPDKRFIFTGKVSDIRPYLAKMDIFAYLLNPKHFGTAEQALQEAMAAGVVPVVLNNPSESSLVQHGKTGLIAQCLEEYCAHIATLQSNRSLREKLSAQARAYAREHFCLETMRNAWENIFTLSMQQDKRPKRWNIQGPIHSLQVFLESLGPDASLFIGINTQEKKEILRQEQWQCASKGSPRHYYSFLGGHELENIISQI